MKNGNQTDYKIKLKLLDCKDFQAHKTKVKKTGSEYLTHPKKNPKFLRLCDTTQPLDSNDL